MNNFKNDIENIKKEIYFLKNKIKELADALNNSGGGGSVDSTIYQRVTILEEKVVAFENSLNSLDADVKTNSTNINEIILQVGEISEQIDLIKSDISSINQEINSLKQTDELLAGNINTINDNISSINEQVSSLNSIIDMLSDNVTELSKNYYLINDEVDDLEKRVVALEESSGGSVDLSEVNQTLNAHTQDITALQEDMAEVQGNVQENSQNIQTLQTSDSSQNTSIADLGSLVSSLTSEIEELKSKMANVKSTRTVVVYDKNSTDESVNFGYPSGITGNKQVLMDLTPYTKVRVYVSLYSMECQQEIVLANRNKYDITFFAMHTTGKYFHITKATIPVKQDRIMFHGYGNWNYSATTDTFEITSGNTIDNVFIYRIEGIIEPQALSSPRYAVKFIQTGATTGDEITMSVLEGQTPKIADPVKDGYTFAGWSLDGVNVVDLTAITSEMTYIAIFTASA